MEDIEKREKLERKAKVYLKIVRDFLSRQDNLDLDDAIENARQLFDDSGEADLALLEQIRHELRDEIVKRVRQIRDAYVLSHVDDRNWYDDNERKRAGHHFPSLAGFLRERKKWNEDTIYSVSLWSRNVVAKLANPERAEFDVRGLVLGYVQSGKTANMTAVIARAVDAGYNFVVVLAGLTDKLRHQTHVRLENDLIMRAENNWHPLTGQNTYDSEGQLLKSGDYIGQTTNKGFPRLGTDVARIAVLKKNSAALSKLTVDINNTSAPVRKEMRLLVIDDEADQASPNTAKTCEDPSTINECIRNLVSSLPTVSYVGYTATPFANVLINPFPVDVKGHEGDKLEDLYPRNFIISLPKPDGYFGTEQIFGRDPIAADDEGSDGVDVIRHPKSVELANLHPKEGDMELGKIPSLRKAIRWFFVSVAARLARGHNDQHASMLVHTSHKIEDHTDLQKLIEPEVEFIKAEYDSPMLTAELQTLWESESVKVSAAEFGNRSVTFNEIREALPEAARRLRIAVENSKSEDRLSYEGPPVAVIAIGGNILARGLTLEGLTVTYFTRNSRQYDTLLQMGRWFGYREGYEDLVRLWLPKKVAESFRQLAVVEHELREEIKEYSAREAQPIHFAVRIRTLPGLTVTGPSKMRKAITADVDYRGTHLQTIRFPRTDNDTLQKNWDAGSKLVSKANLDKSTFVGEANVHTVLEFLQHYIVSTTHRELRNDWLEKYIRHHSGELNTWSVAVVQPSGDDRQEAEKPLGPIKPKLIIRSRLGDPEDESSKENSTADIKALMSRADIMVDVPKEELPDSPNWRADDWWVLKDHRESKVGSRPLILLYPIDRKSKARKPKPGKRGTRIDLDAVHDVLGVAIVFPRLGLEDNPKKAKHYIKVNLEDGSFGDHEDDDPAGGIDESC